MSAIVSGFDQLADDRVVFVGVYDDLRLRGHPSPSTSHDQITRDELVNHLRALAGDIIRDEITHDPERIGYQGPPANKRDHFNEPRGNRSRSRANEILTLPYAPNAITTQDVIEAMKP